MARNVIVAAITLSLLGPGFAAASESAATRGYIYGTVETSSGSSYTGLLRWGTEEAFWDDLFNSSKVDLPYIKKFQRDSRRRNRIKVLGVTIGYRYDDAASSRMFIARFGDIREIRTRRGDKIDLTTKDGVVHSLDGGSNDIGATITVLDDALGRVKIEWKKIEKITFKPTPAGIDPEAFRLYGKVMTDDGTFEGYVQWDVQECLSTDRLDGESEDGDLSIEMGKIAAIEKHNRNGSWIELKDGRRLLLEDTNDVDDSLRGIFVEDERYGRARISWKAFQRAEFRDIGKSGRGYDDYRAPTQLSGKVTDYEERTHSGRIVFDLDESATWEILNGDREGVEYYIPFGMIRSIEPQRGDASNVILLNGTELLLEEGQDVSERNDGVVVIRDNGRETYFRWDEVRRIAFH